MKSSPQPSKKSVISYPKTSVPVDYPKASVPYQTDPIYYTAPYRPGTTFQIDPGRVTRVQIDPSLVTTNQFAGVVSIAQLQKTTAKLKKTSPSKVKQK